MFIKVPPDKKTLFGSSVFLDILEDNYGLRPIIYATEKTYDLYIAVISVIMIYG